MTLFRKHPPTERMADISDDESWRNWFQLYGPKLLLCARQWTRSLADAEDVVQDAFVRFWRHQRELPGDAVALLITSIRRAALDRGRRDGRRGVREDRVASEADPLAARFETNLE